VTILKYNPCVLCLQSEDINVIISINKISANVLNLKLHCHRVTTQWQLIIIIIIIKIYMPA